MLKKTANIAKENALILLRLVIEKIIYATRTLEPFYGCYSEIVP